jgi:hypothetical protein
MSSLQVSTGVSSRNWMGVRGVTHITESSSLTNTLFFTADPCVRGVTHITESSSLTTTLFLQLIHVSEELHTLHNPPPSPPPYFYSWSMCQRSYTHYRILLPHHHPIFTADPCVRGVTHITESSSLTTTLFLQLIHVQADVKLLFCLVIYFIELNLVDPPTFFEEIILPLFSYQFLMSPVAKNVQSTVQYLQFRLHCTRAREQRVVNDL